QVPGSFAYTNPVGSTEIWYAANSKPNAKVITITEYGAWRPEVYFIEVSGISSTNPIDTANGGCQPAPSLANAAIVATSLKNDFIYSYVVFETDPDASLDPISKFIELPKYFGDAAAYLIGESAGSYGAVWEQKGPYSKYCASTAAFRAAW